MNKQIAKTLLAKALVTAVDGIRNSGSCFASATALCAAPMLRCRCHAAGVMTMAIKRKAVDSFDDFGLPSTGLLANNGHDAFHCYKAAGDDGKRYLYRGPLMSLDHVLRA